MISAAVANSPYLSTIYAAAKPYEVQEGNAVNIGSGKWSEAISEPARPDADASLGLDDWRKEEWHKITTSRLARLKRLREGWDGTGSIGISSETIAKADHILSLAFSGIAYPAPPATVPCGDGTLQLEWWLIGTRFTFSIEANGSFESWGLDRNSKHEASEVSIKAIELLRKWASRLTADKLTSAT